MSEAEAQQEPTMEEILASIRRIISDDDTASEASAEDGEDSAAPEAADESAEEVAADEVLELTEVVEDEEPEAAEEAAAPEPEPEPEPEPAPEPEPEPESDSPPEPEPEPEPEAEAEAEAEAVDDEGDRLISGETQAKASAAFHALSKTLIADYAGAGRTLDQLVQDMLRPMLKDWLDENLPDIVERMVEQEIARLTGKK